MLIKIKRIIQFVIAITLVLLPCTPVYALPPNPTSIDLNTAKIFENIFLTGDILVVGEHDIHYTVNITEDPEDAFQLQLRSVDNATIKKIRGATDLEWCLTSIYFSPTQVTSDNIVWESAYTVRISGNPAMFPLLVEGTNMASKVLAPTDWQEDGIMSSKELLTEYCIDIAARMEDDLGVTLLTTTIDGESVLNSTGRVIFLLAIPGLDSAIPDLFQVSSSTPSFPTNTVNATYENETTIALKMGTQIEAAFAGIATFLGVSTQMAGEMWLLLVMLTVASIVFLNSGNTTGAVVLAIPIAVMGAYLGAIPTALLFTVGMFMVAYMFYFIWLRGT